MINKIVASIAEALEGVKDGSTVLIGGFGAVGQPDALIEGLIEQGAKDLVAVLNNAGTGRVGVAKLMELGRVRKIRSEEHTSELQSRQYLVCRLLLEKKKKN